MAALLLILLFTAPASAGEREALFGTWGTPKQCARAPIKDGGTVLAEPFELTSLWLRQGRIWCRLKWFPVEPRKDGLATGAFAQCGEDAVRDYLVRMKLSGDALTLYWGFRHANGPLARCPVS